MNIYPRLLYTSYIYFAAYGTNTKRVTNSASHFSTRLDQKLSKGLCNERGVGWITSSSG